MFRKNTDVWQYIAENGDTYIVKKKSFTNYTQKAWYSAYVSHNGMISNVMPGIYPMTLRAAMQDYVTHYYANIIEHEVNNID